MARKNNDRVLLENLIHKYGKNIIINTLNELNTETFRSAADKARSLGRKKQAQRFEDEYNYRSTNDMLRKLYNKYGKEFKEEIVIQATVLANELTLFRVVSEFEDVMGYLLETPTGYMFATNNSDISYREAVTICAYLGIDESEVSLDAIADIEDYLKGCLSIADARKVAKEFTEYYNGMEKFDWHKYAEL